MIIDSHAHYSHKLYEGEFNCLGIENGSYSLEKNDLEGLFDRMRESRIVLSIEPATSLEKIKDQLELKEKHGDCVRLAMGLHPKRCAAVPFRARKLLLEYAENTDIIAIGETGLDYSMPRLKQNRLRQRRWFIYQIKLAGKLRLPLILHVRDAEEDALRILRRYRKHLCGGVAHCFHGDTKTANAFIDLGFSLGIGGKLLQKGSDADVLAESVRSVPLSALIVETDAPYVLPDVSEMECSGRQRKKMRNSSLILPMIIERIASLRGITAEEAEQAIYDNTLRTFRIEL